VLTEAGTEKTEELKPLIAKIREKAWENLDETDFEEFKRILNTIYNNLEQ
jgi:DNA-binding MarR family transcriptional regulator